jgi:hypothetical protein
LARSRRHACEAEYKILSEEEGDDELSDTEWFLKLKARKDAEEAAQLSAAREEATRRGKEPFSAEVLSRYFTPAYVTGAAHGDVLEALEEYESSYYLGYPQMMTLEEFGRKLTRVFSQAT